MVSQRLLNAFFAGCGILAASAAGQAETRSASESKLLFREVFKSQRFAIGAGLKCKVASYWNQDAVPESIARAYLGSRLHAGLSPPDVAPSAKEILTAIDGDPTDLCDDNDAQRYYDGLLAKLPVGSKVDFERYVYTFPIFDPSFPRAAFVQTNLFGRRISAPSGLISTTRDFTIIVAVFRKEKRRWRLIMTETIGQT